jgi:hypothetical protein
MYEALSQGTIRIEVITGETNSPHGTNIKNTEFPTQFTMDEVVVSF